MERRVPGRKGQPGSRAMAHLQHRKRKLRRVQDSWCAQGIEGQAGVMRGRVVWLVGSKQGFQPAGKGAKRRRRNDSAGPGCSTAGASVNDAVQQT